MTYSTESKSEGVHPHSSKGLISVSKFSDYNFDVIIEVNGSLKGLDLKKGFFNKNIVINFEKIKTFIDGMIKKHDGIEVVYIKDKCFFNLAKEYCKNKNIQYLILGETILINKKVNDEKEKNNEMTNTHFNDEKENNNTIDNTHFDAGMKTRFECLIKIFRNGESRDIVLQIDAKDNHDNCWVCLDEEARWYKGFNRLCSDCVELLESKDNLEYISSNFNKIKNEKRDFFIKEKERIKKESEEARIKWEKGRKERELVYAANAIVVSDFCRKYLSSKDFRFKSILLWIPRNEDVFNLTYKGDLDNLQEYFIELYNKAQEHPSTSADYDELILLEASCVNIVELNRDISKLQRLIGKKGIQTHHNQILDEMIKIVGTDYKKTIEQITIPAYKKISNITTTDKHRIVSEYLKLGLVIPNEMIIESLFEKFGLSYTREEVIHLLNQCIEDADLESFEKNLGIIQKKLVGDFKNLTGHQFEDYLKDIFQILGYEVIRTKLSGDQGADLIIKKDEQKTVVQAKKYFGDVTNKAIQEVVASKEHYGANKAMVVTTGNFTKSAIELAKSNKVELWDKNKLLTIIANINNPHKIDKITQ